MEGKPSADRRGNRKGPGGAMLANCAVLALAALFYFALASPSAVAALAQSRQSPIYRGGSKSSVSLLCAVSWDAVAVEPMLDTLSQSGVDITFAVSGDWAEEHPGLLCRMRDEGHEIAVMCGDNGSGTVNSIVSGLEKALETVELKTGVRPKLFYCGGGSPQTSARAGARLGLDTVIGSIDLDCAGADAALVAKRLEGKAAGGSIICFQPTSSAEQALGEIINYLKNMGFAIVPTHKMLYN